MAYKTAFVAMAPEADPKKHRVSMKLPKYEFTAVLVGLGNVAQAIEVCQDLVKNEGVHGIILCPGFPHEAVAKICSAVGPAVAVNVARGDVPAGMITGQILAKEWH